MANTELRKTINNEIHFNIECTTVGRKYVHFDTFWSKGANVGERGNYQGKVKLPVKMVENYVNKNDWQGLEYEIRNPYNKF